MRFGAHGIVDILEPDVCITDFFMEIFASITPEKSTFYVIEGHQ